MQRSSTFMLNKKIFNIKNKKDQAIVLLSLLIVIMIFAIVQGPGPKLQRICGIPVIFNETESDLLNITMFFKDIKKEEKYKGEANYCLQMINKGTKNQTKLELSNWLEEMGARVEFSVHDDFGLISAMVLQENKDQLIEYIEEVLINSTFPKKEFNRMRKQLLVALKARVEDPVLFAIDENRKHLFGDSYYSYPYLGKMKDLNSIKRQDLFYFYRNNLLNKNRLVIVVSGSLEGKEMAKHIKDLLEKFPLVSQPAEKGVINIINKDDLTVTKDYHTGLILYNISAPSPQDKSFPAWILANNYLTDGLSSPFFKITRDDHGIGYAVGGVYFIRKHTSWISLYVQTLSKDSEKVIGVVDDILEKQIDPGKRSLKNTKMYYVGNFLKDTQSIASKSMLLGKYYIYTGDHKYSLLKKVKKVRYKDFKRALMLFKAQKINNFVLKKMN